MLVQSSSTTVFTVVTLVGTDAISVKSGIYLIMRANICTSVAMGQMGSNDELERAFIGATIYDLFNLLIAVVLFSLSWWAGGGQGRGRVWPPPRMRPRDGCKDTVSVDKASGTLL